MGGGVKPPGATSALRGGGSRKFSYGPYKGQTYDYVALSEEGKKWIKKKGVTHTHKT